MTLRSLPLQFIHLLDQVGSTVRYLQYSLNPEIVYLYRIQFYIRFQCRDCTMTHPRGMGEQQVETFLTMLATECKSIQLNTQSGLERATVSNREGLKVELKELRSMRRKRAPKKLKRSAKMF